MARPRKNELTNVRSHLEHCVLIYNGLSMFENLPPLLKHELEVMGVIAKAILRKNDHHRKDVRVGAR